MLVRTALSLLVLASFGASAQSAAPASHTAPDFALPYSCAYTLSGTTSADTRPSRAIEFERISEVPAAAVASAGGYVREVRDDGHNRYVVIDHGRGWTTTYANLTRVEVRKHQRVEAGQRLGQIAYLGRSLISHLSYMQSHGGQAVTATFNGKPAKYFGQQDYTSRNGCGQPGTVFAQAGKGIAGERGVVTVHAGVSKLSDGIGEFFIPARVEVQCQVVGGNSLAYSGLPAPIGADLWYQVNYFGEKGYVPADSVTLPRGVAPAMCETAPMQTLELGKPVTLVPGEQALLSEGARLAYVGVRSDSRCRPDVQCVWAGQAEVEFKYTPAHGNAERVMFTVGANAGGFDRVKFGSWVLKVTDLGFEKSPKATVVVDQLNTHW